MPSYNVTSPDGKKFRVNAPDGATPDQIMAYAKSQLVETQAEPQGDWQGSSNQPKPFDAMKSLSSVPESAINVATGIGKALWSPLDTAGGLLDAAAGGLRNITPKPIRNLIDKADVTPSMQEGRQRATEQADAVGGVYKDRYGGWENIKRTVETDPVGAVSDLSALLGLGSGALNMAKNATGAFQATAKAAPIIEGVANDLATASKYTNPLSAISPVAKAAGKAASVGLGMTTGVGSENIAQAARAGYDVKPSFIRNLSGSEPITDVLDKAKQGLENMRIQKSADYRANMAAVSNDKSVLGFGGIDTALQDAKDMTSFKGQVKNQKAAQIVQKMAQDVNRWKNLPPDQFHTPEGLDALKQRLGGVLESIPYEEKTARLAAGKVYSAVKDEIAKQAPTYADTMKQYSAASDQIGEIERALSLKDTAAKDTAIRKLQSLTRNNVNTNYGNRLSLAKQLEAQGNVELMPALSGQAMNSWAPRGLVGQGGAYATGMAALSNPYALAALPFQSPKSVGLGTYGAGRVTGVFGRGAGKLGITPEGTKLLGLLAAQLQQNEQKDWPRN